MEEKGIENKIRDFPGSPVVKILPFIAGGASSISGLVPGRGAEIPLALQPKNQSMKQYRSNIVTNAIKTSKMVHIKKKKNPWSNILGNADF